MPRGPKRTRRSTGRRLALGGEAHARRSRRPGRRGRRHAVWAVAALSGGLMVLEVEGWPRCTCPGQQRCPRPTPAPSPAARRGDVLVLMGALGQWS
ncbi:MAG: hypothetical protein U0470_12360 [Anaerolineae bacterium]